MKKNLFTVTSITLTLLISACVKSEQQPNNSMVYKPAVTQASAAEQEKYAESLRLANTAEPTAQSDNTVILPTARGKQLTGAPAIESAKKKAIRAPKSSSYVDSILTFDYTPGSLYEIYTAPLSITDVELQKGEHIIAIAAGDTLRWQVSKTYSGLQDNRTEHLLIKPTDKDLTTTLVATTDQRTYHLLLRSTESTYMPLVKWHYDDADSVNNLANMKSEDNQAELDALAQGLDINHLDLNYNVKQAKGPRPEWFPTLVFNDGNKTYIRFPKKIQEAPTLFIGSSVLGGQIVNYRVVGNYYVIDSLFPEAQLRSGQDNQIIVQISYIRRSR